MFLNVFVPGQIETMDVNGMFALTGPAVSCQRASIVYTSDLITHRTDPDEVKVETCVQIIDPAELPPPVTGLLAVKSIGNDADVDLIWDPATDAATVAYDVWKVVDGDVTVIPFANLPTAMTDNRVLGVCLDVPLGPTPACTDLTAGPTWNRLILYQVRGLNRDGFEGIDHPR